MFFLCGVFLTEEEGRQVLVKRIDVQDPAAAEAAEAILDGVKGGRKMIPLTADQKKVVALAPSSEPEWLPELRRVMELREVGVQPQTWTIDDLDDRY